MSSGQDPAGWCSSPSLASVKRSWTPRGDWCVPVFLDLGENGLCLCWVGSLHGLVPGRDPHTPWGNPWAWGTCGAVMQQDGPRAVAPCHHDGHSMPLWWSPNDTWGNLPVPCPMRPEVAVVFRAALTPPGTSDAESSFLSWAVLAINSSCWGEWKGPQWCWEDTTCMKRCGRTGGSSLPASGTSQSLLCLIWLPLSSC